MQAVFETLFDIVYLITVITLGMIMLKKSQGRKLRLPSGCLRFYESSCALCRRMPGPVRRLRFPGGFIGTFPLPFSAF